MIEIIGAVGYIEDIDTFFTEISEFSKKNKITVQAFNADLIYGKKHIISAVNHAVRSINRNKNTTNSFEMEILLYASGERQLKIAIPKIGIKKGNANIAFVFIGKSITDTVINSCLDKFSLKKDESVLEGDKITLEKYCLKDEIKTVKKDKYQNLILEKIALVDITK